MLFKKLWPPIEEILAAPLISSNKKEKVEDFFVLFYFKSQQVDF